MENTNILKETKEITNKLKIKKKFSQVQKLSTCLYFGIFDCTCCKVGKNNNKSSLSCKENKFSDCTIKNVARASSPGITENNKSPLDELRNEPSTSTSAERNINFEVTERKMNENEENLIKTSETELNSVLSDVRLEEEEIDVVNGSPEDLNNLFELAENRAKTTDSSEQQTSNQVNAELENIHEEIDVVGLNDIPSVSTITSVKRTHQDQSENEPEEEIDVVNLPVNEQNENITSNTLTTRYLRPRRKKAKPNMTNNAEDEVIDVVNLTEDTPPDFGEMSNMLVNYTRALRSRRKVRVQTGVIDFIEIPDSPVAPRVLSGVINIEDDDTPKKSKTGPNCGNCPVCFEDLSKCEIMSTMCGHVFCAPCIKTVVKTAKKCPKCRKNLTLKMVHPLFF